MLVNGTWVNSGVPTSGATGTGAISITAPASTPNGVYFASVCYWDGTYGRIHLTLTSAMDISEQRRYLVLVHQVQMMIQFGNTIAQLDIMD